MITPPIQNRLPGQSPTLRALDLFCGAGGATRGLQQAGFHVTGVDRDQQPRYVGDRFMQGEVFDLIERGQIQVCDYDFVWASPPCQGRTAYRRRPGHVRPVDTDGAIERTRQIVRAAPLSVIENVPGAPLVNPILLCGSMFEPTWNLRRHRIFEASFPLPQIACDHRRATGSFPQATNRKNRRKTIEIGVWRIPLAVQQQAMQIDWMRLEELSEAIPPAYARWIGQHAIRAIYPDEHPAAHTKADHQRESP